MDNSIPVDESTKSLLLNEQMEQRGSTLETSNIPGSQNQLQETTQSEDSADIEDEKVCDVCGDAGLEELLAICSRCSDGAEHTYCMQKKMKELPEGYWLCEECKFKEELGNQNVDKLETVAEALGVQRSTKSNHNTKSFFDLKCVPALDIKALDSEERWISERPQSPQISSKREEDYLEVALKTRKRVLESSCVSTRTADAKNKSFLSHEGSFHRVGADKAEQLKPAPTRGGQSVNNSFIARSQTFPGLNSSKMLDPLQSSHRTLSKSVSFNNSNMKPKVQFIESIPPRLSKESNDTRKGKIKKMSESASFKSIRSGCSNAESIIKTQSLNPPQADDHIGLKETSMEEKKNAMSERPLVNSAPVAVVGSLHSKEDPEVGIVSESKVLDISRGSHDKDNSGCNEGKLSYVSKSFGWPLSILTAQRPCRPVPKEDIHQISGAADRSCRILNACSQRTVPQIVEFSHGNGKIKDATSLEISKQVASGGGSGLLRCRKCNETDHPTQFCSIDKLPVSVLGPSAGRNARDLHNRSNKTRNSTDAPILKSIIQKDIRLRNHSEKLSVPSANLSYEVPSKDLQSGSSSCLGNSGHLERTTYGQDIVRSSVDDPSKTAASVNVTVQAVQVEASCAPRDNNLNPIVTISDQLNAKSLPQVLPNTASILADILKSSVIPDLEFIWQGIFEVRRSGRLLKAYGGIQAHVSTSASPKVLEAAMKFPCKVQLEEATYRSSWPCQYQGHRPDEHNIALFFFAKDIESYKKNYSKLLEDMIKNDLALKGNIAGAELLVFPSNKLPQNWQRWNRLFFLWGVFRVRRPNCSETLPRLLDATSGASLNSETLVQGPQLNAILSCSGVENKVNCLNFGLEGREVNPLHHKEKMEEKGSVIKSDAFRGDDPCEELTALKPDRKHPLSTPTEKETISHAADLTSKCSGKTVHLNEKVDFPLVDDRREHKKMKPENRGHLGCNHRDASYSSHSFDREKMMPGSSSTGESCLFPLELGLVRDTMHNKVIQSSDGVGPADILNLELALGAKKKLSEEGILPPPSSNTGDNMAASLSLSLAFPSSEKEPEVFSFI